ncbi:MAG TPA: aldehyde dehydrogenase family protein [Candidatus Thalassarchaeaceae archaeon]|nr:MAG TPA: aldehyde dehydrogenase family protein [Candidatus Poseidoniales archaeon]HIH83750.1 aldehyde dehydrogenase family protein [Candidatus Thalassarchaeaceae archaeon]
MTHVLQVGLEEIANDNPNGLPKVKGYNIINGKLASASDGSTFESRNPAWLDDCLGEFPLSTKEDVHAALAAARAAFPSWSATPAPTRGQIIGNMGRLLMKYKDDVVRIETREIGKTLKESAGSVQEAIDTCLFFQSEGRRLYGQTVNSELPDKELFTYRRPLGVCGIINACNFPAAVPFWKMIPAIMCGNTCVWKSPQDAPLLSFILARIMHEAGVPDGVINLVHGKGSGAGQHLVDAVDEGMVNKISFTGSTAVGKMIGEVCGRNLVSASLELGGKNPLVVMPSANIDNALEGAYWAAFGTAGQRCTSLGNLIVHKDMYDEFLEKFMDKVESTLIGDSMRNEGVLYGPMLSEKYAVDFLTGIEMCEASGATKLFGQGRISNDNKPVGFQGDASEGVYMWPHVYADVTEEMECFHEEIFGPVVTIVKADDFEHALHLANASPYGLSSAIYTNNRLEAYRYKTGIKAGMTSINNSTSGAEAHLPFGGVKGSGNGTRESGIWVIEAYSYWHAVNDELSGKLQLAQMDVDEIEIEEAEVDYSSLS